MSYLKSKSEFNLDAAKVLIDDYDNYAPSVHCSYYGCFQFIKYKLNKIGISNEQMDIDIQLSKQGSGGRKSSNKYPIELIIDKIRSKTDIVKAKEVKDKIGLLYTYRVDSDYHDVQVFITESNAALNLSKEIIKLIEDIL